LSCRENYLGENEKEKEKIEKKKESEKEMKGETSIHSIIMREIERERYTLDPDCV
jgi:hypothetical protein